MGVELIVEYTHLNRFKVEKKEDSNIISILMQFCDSMWQPLQTVAVALASFGEGYHKHEGPLSRAAASFFHGYVNKNKIHNTMISFFHVIFVFSSQFCDCVQEPVLGFVVALASYGKGYHHYKKAIPRAMSSLVHGYVN